MSEKLALNIGKRIKDIRQELNLQQKDLAAAIGTSGANMSDIENGKITNPGVSIFNKIAKKFNVNLNFLLLGEGEKFIKPTQTIDAESQTAKSIESKIKTNEDLLWMLNHSYLFRLNVFTFAEEYRYANLKMIKDTFENNELTEE